MAADAPEEQARTRGAIGHRSQESGNPRSPTGLALSGGGIRAAAFALGAVQGLRETGRFADVHTISAVSGGNYIASGLATAAALSASQESDLWARGSVEEAHLRANLDYLAPGFRGKLVLSMDLLYGFAVNLFGLGLLLATSGYGLGLLVGLLPLREDQPFGTDPHPTRLTFLVLCLLASLFTIIYGTRIKNARAAQAGRRQLVAHSIQTVGLVSCGVALVVLAAIAASLLRTKILPLGAFSFVVIAAALTSVAVSSSLLADRYESSVLGGFAAIAAGLLLCVPVLAGFEAAWTNGQFIVALALLLMLTGMSMSDVNRTSLNGIYARQLAGAFLLRRTSGSSAECVPSDVPLMPSEILSRRVETGREFPAVTVCTTVNLSRSGSLPTTELFLVGPDSCGSERHGVFSTKELEQGAASGLMTVPGLMATSGAAVAPARARAVGAGTRILLTLGNLRTGLWFPSPIHHRTSPSIVPKLSESLIDTWRRPGPSWTLREALGWFSVNARYIYLTDGGHSDNLGLLPLIAGRSVDIVVIDGTADPGGVDLARAISRARAEYSAEIHLDSALVVDGPVVTGSIEYPDGTHGRIAVLKATLCEDSPWDLVKLAQSRADFPGTRTSNQFFDQELFDAYRTLGERAALALASESSRWDPSAT